MILVTGCAGFIGFHLSQRLLKKNLKIIGITQLMIIIQNLKFKRLNLLKKLKNLFFKKLI